MLKRLLTALALMCLPVAAAAQPVGGAPTLWMQSGPAISPFDAATCLTYPAAVTGGCKGPGTINATDIFLNGSSLAQPALTVGGTFVQGGTGTAGNLLYNNAGVLAESPRLLSNATGQLIAGTGAGASGLGGGALTVYGTDAAANMAGAATGTFIGYQAGKGLAANPQTGSFVVCVGSYACNTIQGSGGSDTVIGYQAGYGMRGASAVTLLGYQAGAFSQSNNNVAVGYQAYLYGAGGNNVFVGRGSGVGTPTPPVISSNALSPGGGTTVFFGDTSLLATGMLLLHSSLVPGTKITAISANVSVTVDTALVADIASGSNFNYVAQHTGNNNVAMGYLSLQNIIGAAEGNTAIGQGAQRGLLTGSRNTTVGLEAGYGLGGPGTQTDNTFVGWQSGRNVIGNQNTGVGVDTLLASGTPNQLTGINNVALGYRAGRVINVGGNQNTVLGAFAGTTVGAGADNVMVGYNAGSNVNGGSNNILIGAGILGTSAGVSNSLNIGGAITGINLGSTPVISITREFVTNSTVAIAAGSASQYFVRSSTTANFGLFYGTGDPTFTAATGSLYVRTDATTATTRLWIRTNAATWAAFTAGS